MSKATIDIETTVSLDLEGITYSTFIGDADIAGIVDWQTLTDEAYEMQCVPSGPIVYDEDNDGVEETMYLVDQLRNAADVLEERVRASKVLLRDKWVKAGMPPDTGPFIVSYNEYLNYVVQGETDD